MPTVDLPGMRSMSTDSACMASERSSARPVILLYFTPRVRLETRTSSPRGPGGSARPSPRRRTPGTCPRAAGPIPSAPVRRPALLAGRVEQGQRGRAELARPARGRALQGGFGVGQGQFGRRDAQSSRLAGFSRGNGAGPPRPPPANALGFLACRGNLAGTRHHFWRRAPGLDVLADDFLALSLAADATPATSTSAPRLRARGCGRPPRWRGTAGRARPGSRG